MCFQKQRSFVKIGRAILKLQEIKDVIIVTAVGETKAVAVAPFNLKIHMKYADNIELGFETWEERAECFDRLWDLLKDL